MLPILRTRSLSGHNFTGGRAFVHRTFVHDGRTFVHRTFVHDGRTFVHRTFVHDGRTFDHRAFVHDGGLLSTGHLSMMGTLLMHFK